MKVSSKVVKFGDRKIIELPKSVRNNFAVGERVSIQKVSVCNCVVCGVETDTCLKGRYYDVCINCRNDRA